MSKNVPIEVTSTSHWNTTLRSAKETGKTIFVDFHATWCGPCKQIAPMYTQLAEQYTQSIFLRVDVDAQKAVAAKYRVSAMPTFITVKAGAQVDGAQVRGADPHRLVQLIAAHAGPNPPVAPLPAAAEAAEAAGNKAFADGEYEAAAVDYTRALEVAPDTVPLLGNRSFAYLKRYGQTKDAVLRRLAVEDATRATELDPQYQKAWVRLAEAFIAESEDDEGADVQVLLRKAEKALKKGVKTGDRKAKTEAQAKLDDVQRRLHNS